MIMNKIDIMEERLNEIDKNLTESITMLNNIQENFLFLKTDISNLTKKINQIDTEIATIKTDLNWIKKIKNGVYYGGTGISIISILQIYDFIKQYFLK